MYNGKSGSATMLPAPYMCMYKSGMTNDVLVARMRSAIGKLAASNKNFLANCILFYNEFNLKSVQFTTTGNLSGALFDGTRMWVSKVNGERIVAVGLALGTFYMVLNCTTTR
jgi:hypothetical protein